MDLDHIEAQRIGTARRSRELSDKLRDLLDRKRLGGGTARICDRIRPSDLPSARVERDLALVLPRYGDRALAAGVL